MILQDPATKHHARTRAEKLRARLAARMSPSEIELIQAQTPSFDSIVRRALASPPLAPED